jgi:MoaA/NifB/PqqE/SkfB family radical SAM enzyme
MELAVKAKAMGCFVQAGTNGIALPPEYAQASAIDRYILPLESASASIHDSLRKHKGGHHGLILSRLEELGRAGKPVTLSTVITRSNLPRLGDLAGFITAYQNRFGNLHAWHLYRMLPFGRGGAESGARLDVGKAEYDSACARLRGAYPGIRIIKRPDMLNSESVGFFWIEKGVVRCRARHPEEFGMPP